MRRGICGACGGERYKLVYYAGRQYGEFYDLQADPGERYNLWEAPPVQAEKRRMLDRLLDRMISLGNMFRPVAPHSPPIWWKTKIIPRLQKSLRF